MSRHYIELPSTLPFKTVGIVCGYDRAPHRHFFLNVCESLDSEHMDEPLWASMLDSELDHVVSVDGFDQKLASMGITLPDTVKLALQADFFSNAINQETWWEPDGTMSHGYGDEI